MLGDFNVDWNSDCAATLHLREIANSLGLAQIIEDVTRPSSNSTGDGTTIDLVFTNRQEKFKAVESAPNPVCSDHQAVVFRFHAIKAPPQPVIVRKYLQYRKADMQHLETLLHLVPWSAFMGDDADSSWEAFVGIFEAAVHDSIPRKQCRNKKSHLRSPLKFVN